MKYFTWIRSVAAVVAAITCLCGSLTLPICAEDTAPDDYEAKRAAYRAELMADDVTTDDLLIGSWVSFYSFDIDSYEKQLDQMAAAGINFNAFPRDFGGDRMYDADYWASVEEEYAKRNMVYLMNGGMSEALVSVGAEYAEGKEHCIGYHLVDEPGGSALTAVGEQARRYRAADSFRYPLVNLLPGYAGEVVLGGGYRDYVSRFIEEAGAENIEYLSHDFYVFGADSDRPGFFADMEVLRSLAYENGKMKTHAFIQSTAWTGMRMPNINEMRWNVYAYLAYGFKGLSWFNLVCPGSSDTEGEGFYDSLIYRDGTIRDPELFAAWSELNWEVRGLSSVLMNLDTTHAYHSGLIPDGVERLPRDFFLKPAGAVGRRFVISSMESKDGADEYVMLFNKDYTQDETTAVFTVEPGSGVKWLEYFDPFIGEYIPVEMKGGRLTDTFRAGEGKLYRVRRDDPPAETQTETEAETETEAPTDTSEGDVTAAPTVGGTDTAAPTDKRGCGSFVGTPTGAGMGAAVLIVAAVAVALRAPMRKDKL